MRTAIKRKRTFERRHFVALMLLPSVLLAIAFLLYPIYLIVSLSFKDGRPSKLSEIGELPFTYDNYANALHDSNLWKSMLTTVVYAGATTVAAVSLGLILALLLRGKLRYRRFWRTLVMLPWPIPGAIASVAFIWMLDGSYGVINHFMMSVGVIDEPIKWFFNPETALIGVLLPTTWIAYPLCVVIILAGLQGIPDELYEAAQLDGASRFARFKYITLPGITPSISLSVVITGLWCFTTFDFVYAITRGGPNRATETLAVAIYNEAFRAFKLPSAAAIGVITIILAAVFVIGMTPLMRKRMG